MRRAGPHNTCAEQGGTGSVFSKVMELVVYGSAKSEACCVFQAEAQALLAGMSYVLKSEIISCTFLTANQSLARACMEYQATLGTDWKAFDETFKC